MSTTSSLTRPPYGPDAIDPEAKRLFQRVIEGDGSEHDASTLIMKMADDTPLYVWVSRNLGNELADDGPVKEQLKFLQIRNLVKACQTYVTAKVGNAPHRAAEQDHRSLFTYAFMTFPTESPVPPVAQQIREQLRLGIDVQKFLKEMHEMRFLLNEAQQARLTTWSSLYDQLTSHDDIQSRLRARLRSRAATSTVPSNESPSRSNRSSNAGNVSESSAAREGDQVAPGSSQDQSPSAPGYRRGDLIDRVASRKATPRQVETFRNKALTVAEFRQEAVDRLELYTSGLEHGKRQKLEAVLNGVRATEKTRSTEAASPQTGEAREMESSRKPARQARARSQQQAPSAAGPSQNSPRVLTWEEEFAQKCQKATLQVRRGCKAIERLGKGNALNQASPEIQQGIRTMHIQAAVMNRAEKERKFPLTGSNPSPKSTADAIKAFDELHLELRRLTEVQMLANASGQEVPEEIERLIARVTRDIEAVTIAAGRPFASPPKR